MSVKTGKNITLEMLRSDDSPVMFKWINTKELVEFNAAFHPVTLEDHNKWFNSLSSRKDMVIFGIRLRSDDTLIGSCQLFSINSVVKSAELQIRIGDFEKMGKGLGSEAVQLLVEYGFKELGLRRIFLQVFAFNTRAIKAYEKCGFVLEGCLREAAFIGDRFVDVLIMSVMRDSK
jgi:RimJ/RimL family protein N-acetyltransferase